MDSLECGKMATNRDIMDYCIRSLWTDFAEYRSRAIGEKKNPQLLYHDKDAELFSAICQHPAVKAHMECKDD